jgi:Putative Zn-dependent protease, contains TPR repeats
MDTKARLALSLFALCALTACGDNPDELFQKAQQSFAVQDFQGARGTLIAALAEKPADPAMLTLLVRSQIGLGDVEGAERSLDRLAQKDVPRATMQRLKAHVSLLKGDPQGAIGLLGNDCTTEAWLIRAEANVSLGDDASAREAFERGMETGNDMALAASYARFALRHDNVVLARKIVQRMKAISSDAFETLALGAAVTAAQGRTDEAISAYRLVIEKHSQRVEPYLSLAYLLDAQGKLDEASKLVTDAEKLDPGNAEAEELKYLLLAEKGEWEKIRIDLQSRESSLDPTSGLGLRYAEALLRLGFAQQARMMFKRAALLLPGNPYTQMMLGEAQLASGDPDGAWQTLKPLAASTLARPEVLESAEKAARVSGAPEADTLRARLDPAKLKNVMTYVERGDAAIMRQDWRAAIDVYGKLLQRGEDPEVLKRLALASSGLGRPQEAIRYADRALACAPDNSDYLYLAGSIRLKANQDLSKALQLLSAAASGDPRNPVIAQDLKKAEAAAG